MPHPRTPSPALLCLDDFEAKAKELMPPGVYEYIASGSADEVTLGWNREKYREIVLQQKVLIDVSGVDCSTALFGQPMSMPILLAPTSNHRYVHPEGEIETARGAAKAGITLVMSNGATSRIEDVMAVAKHPVWFQLYASEDRGHVRSLVERVERAGARALCVTVDAPLDGPRNRMDRTPLPAREGITYPQYPGSKLGSTGITPDQVRPKALTWRDIEWIRTLTKMPLLLKGVMNPLDADAAIQSGADGIVVSNHGARCLDTQPATIQALPRVAEKVGGRVPVLVDGGIRRGTDVVKALALGASAVQIGRPYLYGLAVGGADGVAEVVRLLRQELLMAMALLGRPNLASVDRSVLWS